MAMGRSKEYALISTHAPTRGATEEAAEIFNAATLNFYSRPYARGDRTQPSFCLKEKKISTHAPTRGATRQGCMKRSPERLFLLTPLREGRPGVTHTG